MVACLAVLAVRSSRHSSSHRLLPAPRDAGGMKWEKKKKKKKPVET